MCSSVLNIQFVLCSFWTEKPENTHAVEENRRSFYSSAPNGLNFLDTAIILVYGNFVTLLFVFVAVALAATAALVAFALADDDANAVVVVLACAAAAAVVVVVLAVACAHQFVSSN